MDKFLLDSQFIHESHLCTFSILNNIFQALVLVDLILQAGWNYVSVVNTEVRSVSCCYKQNLSWLTICAYYDI